MIPGCFRPLKSILASTRPSQGHPVTRAIRLFTWTRCSITQRVESGVRKMAQAPFTATALASHTYGGNRASNGASVVGGVWLHPDLVDHHRCRDFECHIGNLPAAHDAQA